MKYLLDTSICVFFLRGKLNLDEKIREKGRENIFISEITVAELYFGAENSDNPTKSFQTVDNFISGVTVIPIYGCLRHYAKEKVKLRKAGKIIHDEFDLLIAVTSVVHKLTLVTDNIRDMERVDKVKIENWMVRKRL
jgi:tRNA(fMet)-specific endonuclease VapC